MAPGYRYLYRENKRNGRSTPELVLLGSSRNASTAVSGKERCVTTQITTAKETLLKAVTENSYNGTFTVNKLYTEQTCQKKQLYRQKKKPLLFSLVV